MAAKTQQQQQQQQQQKQLLKVVEFYCGIGGMHYALKACGIPTRVVAAIDINTTANKVYSHNFPETRLLNNNIEGMQLDAFIKLDADAFVMSPPCQPFTRQGHQKASNDARTKSFLHIMTILKSLPRPPSYILMENVKGFEVSDTRDEFIKTLKEANFVYQEFLLSPTQFGLPNSRLRYFLLAVHRPLKFPFQVTESVMNCLLVDSHQGNCKITCSGQNMDNPRANCQVCSQTIDHLTILQPSDIKHQRCSVANGRESKDMDHYTQTHGRMNPSSYSGNFSQTALECTEISTHADRDLDHCEDHCQDKDCVLKCSGNKSTQNIINIVDFLEPNTNNFDEFLLPENILRNKVLLMDIVQKGCNHSCCFTKGYGHYVEGTGSVLQMTSCDASSVFQQYSKVKEEERSHLLACLGLRYFTPREIANFHYFPPDFNFPVETTTKQKYRLLGNSLNVLVVSHLMKLLFASTKPS